MLCDFFFRYNFFLYATTHARTHTHTRFIKKHRFLSVIINNLPLQFSIMTEGTPLTKKDKEKKIKELLEERKKIIEFRLLSVDVGYMFLKHLFFSEEEMKNTDQNTKQIGDISLAPIKPLIQSTLIRRRPQKQTTKLVK